MGPQTRDSLLRPPFLIALALLLSNDLLLKLALPGLLTGKISDFTGLFVFSVFWSTLFPRQRLLIHLVAGAGFTFWKSPYAGHLIDFWNHVSSWRVGRTVDYTDLVALAILPAAYQYASRNVLLGRSATLRWRPAIAAISMIAFAATSYRTTFRYDKRYRIPVPPPQFLEQVSALRIEHWNYGKDSVEVWVPADVCFGKVYAVLAFATDSTYPTIGVRQLTHHCPEGRGDSLELLRVLERCFLARIDSGLSTAASLEGRSHNPIANLTAGMPRHSCVPRDRRAG